MITFTDAKNINLQQWNDLSDHSIVANFFQTPECYNFYKSLSFFEPFAYSVSENDNLLGVAVGYITSAPGLLKRGFSRRAVIQGGLLLDNNITDDVLYPFLDYIKNQLQRCGVIYVEIRNNNDYSKYKVVFEKSGFAYKAHLNYKIDLSDKGFVFSQLSKSKQRQIKTALKNGVYWEETRSEDDIHAYYSILKSLYKTKIKRPLFPIEYIEKLIQLPEGRLLVVKRDNAVIGGMVCCIFSDKVIYELFVCGDHSVEKDLYPSVMATWAGIEYGIDQRVGCFDFMGAGKPSQEYGVREFKSKFGGNLVENGRFLYVYNSFLYKTGKFVVEKILS